VVSRCNWVNNRHEENTRSSRCLEPLRRDPVAVRMTDIVAPSVARARGV
jgi:hypothetical protein